MDLKVVELFAGVGGFRVGLNKIEKFDTKSGKAIENNDWQFVWANQWEPSTKTQPAYECYTKRFGNENHSNINISLVNKQDIPDHTLLVGGFPCQDYSVARSLSNERGIEGKKGVLWWDIVDIIFNKKPPFILLENVDRLLKSPAKQRGRDFAIMLKTLDNLGYFVQWRVINAGEYGMPQRRRRVFIFAALKNSKYGKNIINIDNYEDYLINDGFFNDIFPIKIENLKFKIKSLAKFKDEVEVSENYNEDKFLTSGIYIDNKVINFDVEENFTGNVYTLGQVVEQAKPYTTNELSSYIIEDENLDKWKYLKSGKKINRVSKTGHEYVFSEGAMCFPDNLDLPGRTMLTSESSVNRSSHIIFDESINKHRIITEVEAELLQMFPPNWTDTGMTRKQRYFMMGNALVTGIISKLENKLKNIIVNE